MARNADGSRITTAQRLQSHDDDDDDVAVSVSGIGAGGGLGTGLGAGTYSRARSAAVHEATEEGEALMQQLPAFMRNRCGRVWQVWEDELGGERVGARVGGSQGKVQLLRASTVQVMPFLWEQAASAMEPL